MRRFRPAPSRPSPSSNPSRGPTDDTWLMPLPVPDAREGGESTWALWHEAERQLDEAFADTEPSDLAPLMDLPPPVAEQVPQHRFSADGLMLIARRNNRVCPRPAAWTELYRLLQGDRYDDLQPPPVEQWIWGKLSALQKRLRFKETIEWADRHGKLDVLARFMIDLPEDDWLHMG